MAQHGPAPKPTALKKLQGNPGKRALPVNEPQPPTTKAPAAPRYLSDDAKREWRRVAPTLQGVGLLTDVDHDALAMYCERFAEWKTAWGKVLEEGAVITTTAGNLIQNPRLSIANRAAKEALALAREFGMTPAARTRIQVDMGGNEPTLAEQLFELAIKD